MYKKRPASPNPSGWRKESEIRDYYALQAQSAQIGSVSRSELWAVVQQAMRVLRINPTQQKILETLIWRTFETDWKTGNRPIVWLSNIAIAREAGLYVKPNTVRASLAALADAGLISFRDSANCRRTGRRENETIVYAYGIDLSVLIARYDELRAMVSAQMAEEREIRSLRTDVQSLRRSIPAHIQNAYARTIPGRWQTFERRYQVIVAKLGRSSSAPVFVLRRIYRSLKRLLHAIRKAASAVIADKIVANPLESECLLETTNGPLLLSCNKNRHCANAQSVHPDSTGGEAASETAYEINELGSTAENIPESYTVDLMAVVQACPEVSSWAPEGEIRSWGDLIAAGASVRQSIGISIDAWVCATRSMGRPMASAVMAVILEKYAVGQISSPGGYLRAMTDRFIEGQLRLDRSIIALMAEQMRSAKNDGNRVSRIYRAPTKHTSDSLLI